MEKYFDTRLDKANRLGADRVWGLIAQDIISRVPGKVQNLLDLGAGYGDFINQAAAAEKWAVDVWPGMAQNLAVPVKSVIADITGPLNGLPRDHFDLCFMSNVLEHFTIEDCAKIIQNVKAHGKVGSHLALLQPNFTFCSRNYFDDYTHKTIFTAEGLGNFLRDQGLELVVNKARYLPFSFKSRLPRPLWAVKMYLNSPWRPLGAQMLLVARIQQR